MKQHKKRRSEKPKPEKASAYSHRQRTSLESRHDRHSEIVYACPLCAAKLEEGA